MAATTPAEALREREVEWRGFLATHLATSEVVAVSRSDGDRRVARTGDQAVKVTRRPVTAPPVARSLEHELRVLERLAREGLAPGPGSLEHLATESGTVWEVLTVPWLPGLRAADAGRRLSSRTLLRLLLRLHRQGIAHGDLNPGNVVVLADGTVGLIDFERSWSGHPLRVAVGDLTGRWLPPGQPARSLVRLLVQLGRVPGVRPGRAQETAGRHPVEDKIGRRPLDGDDDLAAAWRDAWRHGGRNLPYGFELSGRKYRGDHSWCTVWESVRSTGVALAGRRFTEVSTGLPLASAWAWLDGAEPVAAVVPSPPQAAVARRFLAHFPQRPEVRAEVGRIGTDLLVLSDPAATCRTLDGTAAVGPGVRDVLAVTTSATRDRTLAALAALGLQERRTVGLGTSPLPVVLAGRGPGER